MLEVKGAGGGARHKQAAACCDTPKPARQVLQRGCVGPCDHGQAPQDMRHAHMQAAPDRPPAASQASLYPTTTRAGSTALSRRIPALGQHSWHVGTGQGPGWSPLGGPGKRVEAHLEGQRGQEGQVGQLIAGAGLQRFAGLHRLGAGVLGGQVLQGGRSLGSHEVHLRGTPVGLRGFRV